MSQDLRLKKVKSDAKTDGLFQIYQLILAGYSVGQIVNAEVTQVSAQDLIVKLKD
jgi:hypothetical protein